VVQLVSGAPLNAVMSSSNSSTNCANACGRQRPNKIGDPNTAGDDLSRVAYTGNTDARWFKSAAFSSPGKGSLGGAPRTITAARYQFRKNIDMVIAKDTEVGGGAVAQVRFEILNLTNTAKFGGVSSNSIGSSTFGRVTQQVGFMRIWQLSFRLTY
jgi:hypothetical protein